MFGWSSVSILKRTRMQMRLLVATDHAAVHEIVWHAVHRHNKFMRLNNNNKNRNRPGAMREVRISVESSERVLWSTGSFL